MEGRAGPELVGLGRNDRRDLAERGAGVVLGAQERGDTGLELGVLGAGLFGEVLALPGRELDRIREDPFGSTDHGG